MEHVVSKETFAVRSRGALSILDYVKANSDLRSMQLDFQYGLLEGKTRAVARFCANEGPKRAIIWVSANATDKDRWLVSHNLGWN